MEQTQTQDRQDNNDNDNVDAAAAQPQPQAEDRLPGQQADGGFFPPPDDPNYAQWVAGGVGH